MIRNDVTEPYVLVDVTSVQDRDTSSISETIEAIKLAGADGVCPSLFRTSRLISMIHCPDEADRYRKLELKKSDFQEIFEQHNDDRFDLIPTVYDRDLLEWYDNVPGNEYVCVDPGDIIFKRLLTKISDLELSPLLSIKASKRETVARALEWLTHSPNVILLANLVSSDTNRLVDYLGRLRSFDCDGIGFDDQSGEPELAKRARKNGTMLWKPALTPEENEGYSLEELEDLIEVVKSQEGTLPDPDKDEWTLTSQDRSYQRQNRRSLMADRGLPAGGSLEKNMVRELRPGEGLPADTIDELEGMLIQRPVEAQQMITY